MLISDLTTQWSEESKSVSTANVDTDVSKYLVRLLGVNLHLTLTASELPAYHYGERC